MAELNRRRMALLRGMVPRLFDEPGRTLYVGAYDRRFWASGVLVEAGHELTVLEVWPEFLDNLMASRFKGRVAHAVLGDVREVDKAELPYDAFDYVLWFHGPEHIAKIDFVDTVNKLEALTKRVIVMTCPWGRFVHGIAYDNPHTEHKGHYYPEDFVNLRYQIAGIGPPDKPGSQLQAWKQLG